ncbi:hypothetical protein ACFE04_008012 [Oxalis oulophora]
MEPSSHSSSLPSFSPSCSCPPPPAQPPPPPPPSSTPSSPSEMGRRIVEEQSSNKPAKGSRFWRHELSRLFIPGTEYFVGLVCSICQSIVVTINYLFVVGNGSSPIKISVWPIVFAFVVVLSKVLEARGKLRTLEGRSSLHSKES